MPRSLSLNQAMSEAQRETSSTAKVKSHSFNVQEINGHQISVLIYQADYSEENGQIEWSDLRYMTFVDDRPRSGGVFVGVLS